MIEPKPKEPRKKLSGVRMKPVMGLYEIGAACDKFMRDRGMLKGGDQFHPRKKKKEKGGDE